MLGESRHKDLRDETGEDGCVGDAGDVIENWHHGLTDSTADGPDHCEAAVAPGERVV